MSAFYNEFDAYPAQWIRNLAAAGLVASGVVDERSIKEVQPADVGDGQVHLFAGIAVWSHALRLAGWPDEFPVWTASCPCQPFSSAGRGAGVDDPRHLWPDAFRLISGRRPVCVVGEQVASPDGLAWLDAVFADLEGAGYACRALDLCAVGFGAPHIRQRLYWAAIRSDRLAHHHQQGRGQFGSVVPEDGHAQSGTDVDGRGEAEWLADDGGEGRSEVGAHGGGRGEGGRAQGLVERLGDSSGRLGFAGFAGLEGHAGVGEESARSVAAPGPTNGAWADVEWLPCRDGKLRPTQPGLFPLAHGATSRVGRLRAYGNAIVAPQAAEFLQALKPLVEHLWEEA